MAAVKFRIVQGSYDLLKGYAASTEHAQTIARSYLRSLNKALKAEGKKTFSKKDLILLVSK